MAILRNGRKNSAGTVEQYVLGIGSDGGASVAPIGATSCPVNTTVSVGTTNTPLVTAAGADVRGRTVILFSGVTSNPTAYVAEGESATTGKFPVIAGYTLVLNTLLAVNAIAASGSASISVLVEQW